MRLTDEIAQAIDETNAYLRMGRGIVPHSVASAEAIVRLVRDRLLSDVATALADEMLDGHPGYEPLIERIFELLDGDEE